MNQQIIKAIREKKVIEFDYQGYHRVAEPHVYGQNQGVDQLLVYQIRGGSSSGRLPNWRRVDLQGMINLIVTEETFHGPRTNVSGRHSTWDITYEIVR